MAKYVDGFVLVVPKAKSDEYRKIAQQGNEPWMRHGALGYYECKGDDMAQMDMGGEKTRSFPDMAGANDDEEVWFSFIIFKSKEHRDEVNAKVMKEMEEQSEGQEPPTMPFDMQRMAYGGFEVAVEGQA